MSINWNAPRYVELRRRLLEEGLFPVCRRCCKVELSQPADADALREPAAAVAGSRV